MAPPPGAAISSHGRTYRSLRRALLSLVWLCVAGGWSEAATFVVDTTSDAVDALPGDAVCVTATATCSLRAAVQEANALAGDDDIDLPAGAYVLTLAGPGEDASARGDLDVSETLTITGAGAGVTMIDGNAASRLFEVIGPYFGPPVKLTLVGVTVRNGQDPSGDGCDGYFSLSGGGAICANGAGIYLTGVVVEDNVGSVAIMSLGGSFTASTIRNNSGIGLYAAFLGGVTMVDSTVSGNAGGGIGLGGYTVSTIKNTTISGNGPWGISQATLCEPGFPCDPGDATLSNVTITGHTVAVDNVVRWVTGGPVGSASTIIRNSLLAGNGSECAGGLDSHGHNFLQILSDCTVIGDTTGNIVGRPAFLGALQDNGGATGTHALLPPSLAINAGNPAAPGSGGDACEAADQRGVARPVGPLCDIGAFESTCGDGTTDGTEQCDDGNAIDGDGCQHNCRLPGCGDAILDPGEACDDGGNAESCCSAGCTLAAAGAPCSSPGDLCTADVCDAVGQCRPTCGPCFTCEPTVGCALPSNSCDGAAPAGSQITIKDQDKDTADATTWRWKGTGVTTKADFGNPTAGGAGYALCVYDDAGGASVLADIGAGCDQAFCWTETSRAFKLKSGTATQGKVTAVLTAGTPGKMLIKTRGSTEGVPALPLTTPGEVRFIRKDGGCWGASYGTGVKKNSAQVFSAKSD